MWSIEFLWQEGTGIESAGTHQNNRIDKTD